MDTVQGGGGYEKDAVVGGGVQTVAGSKIRPLSFGEWVCNHPGSSSPTVSAFLHIDIYLTTKQFPITTRLLILCETQATRTRKSRTTNQ